MVFSLQDNSKMSKQKKIIVINGIKCECISVFRIVKSRLSKLLLLKLESHLIITHIVEDNNFDSHQT